MRKDLFQQALAAVAGRFSGERAHCAIILGSGWSKLAESFRVRASLDYSEIPSLGTPSVEGHAGRLILAERNGFTVLIFAGRRHWYEGVGWEPIALPVYLARALGCGSIILTNAAGAVNRHFAPGDIMVIDDHVNAMGANPLVGEHDSTWGPRFPEQSHVYSAALRRLLDEAASELNFRVRHGVYAAMSGPFFETPAEISSLRVLGVDAVGMSTVPEASLACAAGLEVAGISCITNMAAGLADPPSHEEVVSVTARTLPRLDALINRLLDKISPQLRRRT